MQLVVRRLRVFGEWDIEGHHAQRRMQLTCEWFLLRLLLRSLKSIKPQFKGYVSIFVNLLFKITKLSFNLNSLNCQEF